LMSINLSWYGTICHGTQPFNLFFDHRSPLRLPYHNVLYDTQWVSGVKGRLTYNGRVSTYRLSQIPGQVKTAITPLTSCLTPGVHFKHSGCPDGSYAQTSVMIPGREAVMASAEILLEEGRLISAVSLPPEFIVGFGKYFPAAVQSGPHGVPIGTIQISPKSVGRVY
jgi:hypothetical protein